jgi:hypothetical protein
VRRLAPGLIFRSFARVFCTDMFIDTCRPELGISAADLTAALHELPIDG